MSLIPSLFPIIATCGVLFGVYAPVSLSTLKSNSISSVPEKQQSTQTQAQAQLVVTNSPDYKKLSYEDPVLSCEQYERSYKVYLAVSEGEWKKESSANQITFKVVDVKDGEKVVYGPGANAENKWSNWRLRFGDNGEVKLNFPSAGGAYQYRDYLTVLCQMKKISKTLKEQGMEITIVAVKDHKTTHEMKVEVDSKKCNPKSSEDKEECDIIFSSGVNLQWEGISPKAIFPLSGKK